MLENAPTLMDVLLKCDTDQSELTAEASSPEPTFPCRERDSMWCGNGLLFSANSDYTNGLAQTQSVRRVADHPVLFNVFYLLSCALGCG